MPPTSLMENGYDVLVALNGAEAIEKVISSRPDLLLLDLRLPVMHGLDVYLELKKRDRLLPTIIVTAYPREEINAVNALKSLAVTGCLFKPFEPETLLQAVADLAQERGTDQ